MKDKNLRVVLSFLGILTFFRPLKTSTGVMELWNTFYSIWKNSGWEFSYILLMMLGQEKENQSFFRTYLAFLSKGFCFTYDSGVEMVIFLKAARGSTFFEEVCWGLKSHWSKSCDIFIWKINLKLYFRFQYSVNYNKFMEI